jgi:hypothetical protein
LFLGVYFIRWFLYTKVIRKWRTNMLEIIELAKQSDLMADGEMWFSPTYGNADVHITDLERFAKLVAEKEREACAKLAQETICDTHIPTGVNIYGTRVAKAIRARGQA